MCPDDLNSMYASLGEKTNVFLWCDARSLIATGGKCDGKAQLGGKKHKSLATSEPPTSKRKQTEDEDASFRPRLQEAQR